MNLPRTAKLITRTRYALKARNGCPRGVFTYHTEIGRVNVRFSSGQLRVNWQLNGQRVSRAVLEHALAQGN